MTLIDTSKEIIRPAEPGDIPRLSQLFREVFGHDRAEEIWSWKLFNNPRGTASFVCDVGDRIVAHCAGTPVRFRDYATEYVALQLVDFMSSPRYPGGVGRGGVFVRTVLQFFDTYCGPQTVSLVYGFPGERHRVLGERVLGYSAIEPVVELRIDEFSALRTPPQPLTSELIKLFVNLPTELGAVRDEPYLRWRYLSHPVFRYHVVAARGLFGRAKTAALIREDEDIVHVMEIGGDFSRQAIAALVEQLSRLGKPVRGWGSPLHPVSRLLIDGGFRAHERDHSLECRFFIQRPTPRPGEFYYTLGDYDVF